MGRIDVEKAIEELTLGEKVALTAGMLLELLSEDPKTRRSNHRGLGQS